MLLEWHGLLPQGGRLLLRGSDVGCCSCVATKTAIFFDRKHAVLDSGNISHVLKSLWGLENRIDIAENFNGGGLKFFWQV